MEWFLYRVHSTRELKELLRNTQASLRSAWSYTTVFLFLVSLPVSLSFRVICCNYSWNHVLTSAFHFSCESLLEKSFRFDACIFQCFITCSKWVHCVHEDSSMPRPSNYPEALGKMTPKCIFHRLNLWGSGMKNVLRFWPRCMFLCAHPFCSVTNCPFLYLLCSWHGFSCSESWGSLRIQSGNLGR